MTGNARKRESARTRLLHPTPAEKGSFDVLQQLFTRPGVLTYFDPTRPLYIDIDASVEVGFGAYAYHVKDDAVPKQKSQQPVLFLSKTLTPAETRYWPTELEVAGLVWVVKKLRHLIEATNLTTVVYTDHQAIVDIAKQSSLNTTSLVRLNLRHVRSSEYLARFRLDIRYKPGKTNTVPDALSRLPKADSIPDVPDRPLAVTQAQTHLLQQGVQVYPVIAVVEFSAQFLSEIAENYDQRCKQLIEDVRINDDLPRDNQAVLPFKVVEGHLYFDNRELGPRLVIPKAMAKALFKSAHDDLGHLGYERIHERLCQNFYIFRISTLLREYISHCAECQSRRTPRHRPYGSLQPILSPPRPFHTLAMDFILALPSSVPDRYDCALTVTNKFSKAITIIPGQVTYSAVQWAVPLLERLQLLLWGLPMAIISDRDPKFVSVLWRTMMERLGVRLIFTTAWHPSADGMSERTNQTVEIALRYLLATLEDHRQWPSVLARLTASLNNSTSRGTGMEPWNRDAALQSAFRSTYQGRPRSRAC